MRKGEALGLIQSGRGSTNPVLPAPGWYHHFYSPLLQLQNHLKDHPLLPLHSALSCLKPKRNKVSSSEQDTRPSTPCGRGCCLLPRCQPQGRGGTMGSTWVKSKLGAPRPSRCRLIPHAQLSGCT